MTRMHLVAPALASLALAGCGTTSGGSITPANIDATIAQIQSVTQTVCRFAPTAGTIANIIDALGVTGAGAVGDIANQICNAVTKVGARRGAFPTVKGVRIRGAFVR